MMQVMGWPVFLATTALLLLSGCAAKFQGADRLPELERTAEPNNPNAGRYAMAQDRGPDRTLVVADIQEETPVWEPPGRAGNRSPYEVLGRSYVVLPTADGFVEEGLASWYGAKFHGYKTSNGETFDMYRISAAHTRLPLPTWVRVTNLENNKSIVVRVNDRGPFHADRIIDLSYAAAVKLDMARQGTARVRVEALNLPRVEANSHLLQLATFSQRTRAQKFMDDMRLQYPDQRFNIASSEAGYRVRMGPMGVSDAERLREQISQRTGDRPLIIRAN